MREYIVLKVGFFRHLFMVLLMAVVLMPISENAHAVIIGTGQSIGIAFDANAGQDVSDNSHVFTFQNLEATGANPFNNGDVLLFELFLQGNFASSFSWVVDEAGFGPFTSPGPISMAAFVATPADLAGILKITLTAGSVEFLDQGFMSVNNNSGTFIADNVALDIPAQADGAGVPVPGVLLLMLVGMGLSGLGFERRKRWL